ncbi:MAG: hypothetical protein JJU19_14240, partial [Pararhodobacter sp.]|nr:hypothetical protein [Pararhodobacter sp.]
RGYHRSRDAEYMAAPDQSPKITDPLSRGSHPYMVQAQWRTPFDSTAPPAVVFHLSYDRGGEHPEASVKAARPRLTPADYLSSFQSKWEWAGRI